MPAGEVRGQGSGARGQGTVHRGGRRTIAVLYVHRGLGLQQHSQQLGGPGQGSVMEGREPEQRIVGLHGYGDRMGSEVSRCPNRRLASPNTAASTANGGDSQQAELQEAGRLLVPPTDL